MCIVVLLLPVFGITVVVFRELSTSLFWDNMEKKTSKHSLHRETTNVCLTRMGCSVLLITDNQLVKRDFYLLLMHRHGCTCLCCKINVLHWDILLLSGLKSAPFQPGIFTYIDLSKLSNLGTYQEIGKGYDDTATERNLSKNTTQSKEWIKDGANSTDINRIHILG